MERMKMKELEIWKYRKNRKPLIIKGARQVGKTWLMKEFGRRFFRQVAYALWKTSSSQAGMFLFVSVIFLSRLDFF